MANPMCSVFRRDLIEILADKSFEKVKSFIFGKNNDAKVQK
jgi:hypothetical protein